MKWTKEQELAIFERGQNIIVSAGAGSGKTAVLSERALDYCLKGNDIRKLLILTFTKAAASEMKERIRKKLIKNELYEQASYIDAAYITTFDAYSLAIVKKYNYVLDLSKDLSIMDGALISIKREEIAKRIFKNFYETNNIEFFSLLKKYSKQDDKDVLRIVLDLCDKLDLVIDIDKFINTYEEEYYSSKKLNDIVYEYEGYALSATNDFLCSLKDLIDICSSDSSSVKKADELQTILSNFNGLSTYDEFYSDISSISFPKICTKPSETLKESWDLCKSELKDLKEKIYDKYENVNSMLTELNGVKNDVLFILKIVKQVYDELLKFKMEVQMFDYTDIAKFAIKIVEENKNVKDELINSYNEIMVDEYQDTSDIQEMFINLISKNNIYMVGDIKQSIYRFRNANPYIFKDKYDNYAKNNGGIKIDLNNNFRSRSEVLDDINNLFTKLMTNSCGDANYLVEHIMHFGLNDYDKDTQDLNFNLENLTYSKDGYDQYTDEEIEAFIIADKIRQLKVSGIKVYDKDIESDDVSKKYRPIMYNDFAILISKASSFVVFKQIFEYIRSDPCAEIVFVFRFFLHFGIHLFHIIHDHDSSGDHRQIAQ